MCPSLLDGGESSVIVVVLPLIVLSLHVVLMTGHRGQIAVLDGAAGALEGLLTRVRPHVGIKLALLLEKLGADCTLVSSLTMCQLMSSQVDMCRRAVVFGLPGARISVRIAETAIGTAVSVYELRNLWPAQPVEL